MELQPSEARMTGQHPVAPTGTGRRPALLQIVNRSALTGRVALPVLRRVSGRRQCGPHALRPLPRSVFRRIHERGTPPMRAQERYRSRLRA